MPGPAPSASPADYALRVDGLTVQAQTPDGPITLVDDVSFAIRPGQVMGLVGESGCGKSTVSLAVMRLLAPSLSISQGSVVLSDGSDVTKMPERRLRKMLGKDVAMIFQEPMTSLNPVYTVGDQLTEPLRIHMKMSRKQARARAEELLVMVGIGRVKSVLAEYPHRLSGGMRQRVMIAMAMACDPKVLICDEPTTALDVTIQAQILDLIRNLVTEHATAALFISHDLGVVADICDDVSVMYAGQVVETSPMRSFVHSSLHPYALGLRAATPSVVEDHAELASIPGMVPRPGTYEGGCRFADRCTYARPECRTPPTIPLQTVLPQHAVRCVRQPGLVIQGRELAHVG